MAAGGEETGVIGPRGGGPMGDSQTYCLCICFQQQLADVWADSRCPPLCLPCLWSDAGETQKYLGNFLRMACFPLPHHQEETTALSTTPGLLRQSLKNVGKKQIVRAPERRPQDPFVFGQVSFRQESFPEKGYPLEISTSPDLPGRVTRRSQRCLC